MIKTFEIFEPRTMQHQQNRNDFADAQAGLWLARRGVVPEQIGFPLWQKRLQKSSTAQKFSINRSNMLTSYGMVGSAQFLESLIHNVLMPPIPVIRVS
jgi:hypothetical protein